METSFRMLQRESLGICRSAEKRTIRLMSVAEGFQVAKKLYSGRTAAPSASMEAIRATIQERNGVP